MRTLLVLLLWTAGLAAAGQFAKFAAILPELALAYPQAGATLGWLVSLISLVGIALGLFAGVTANRLGPRRLLLASLALGAVISCVQALLPPLPLMLVLRVAEGLSHLGIVVAAPTLIAAISCADRRGLAMTLWGTFFGVAFALVALAAPALVGPHGPAGLLLAHALFTAAVAVALFRLPRDIAVPDASPLTPAQIARRHAQTYASPAIAAPALGWLFYTVTFVSFLAVLPNLAPQGARGLVATWAPLASIASSMTLGLYLLRRTSAVSVVLAGFALATVAALSMLAAPGHPALAVALFAALGLVQGASFAAVPELNPSAEAQSLANGAMAQTGNTGNTLGTPLVLALLAAGGVPAMVALAVACFAAGIAVHLVLAGRRGAVTAP